MSRYFSLKQLTEGIRDRNVGQEGTRLVEKWNRTGLLRGLENETRENMSRLLENQAAQLLREANTLGSGGGDIRGFTNIAFPIVRRVFGGLIANDLVSVQPMSLPSGLLFYLDYTYGSDIGGDSDQNDTRASGNGTGATDATASTYTNDQSLYSSPQGRGIRSGSLAVGGQYDLAGTMYSRVHKNTTNATDGDTNLVVHANGSGSYGGGTTITAAGFAHATGTDGKLLQFDPQITQRIEESGDKYHFLIFKTANLPSDIDLTAVKDFALYSNVQGKTGLAPVNSVIQGGTNIVNVRRLNQLGEWDSANHVFTANGLVEKNGATSAILTVCSGAALVSTIGTGVAHLSASYVVSPSLNADSRDGSALTIPSFESDFNTNPAPAIPEIDIKIESIAVTAVTRKLRARWSPELAQDLNAYHSMDAEVELTQILSEQIALEIDREILNDLISEARGANFFWSRAPGKFVNKRTGAAQQLASTLQIGPSFTGTVREWYETLVETIIDVANEIHRKTLRGSANFIVTSPEVSTIFEASVLYKPNYKLDGQGQVSTPFSLGAEAVGSLSNRFTVYKDPYFPRNKILVGYKGGSYLETGYVYAPYVPLIVTPTVFAPEDFTPRKGVMTRYGKKMVRADFYGTVTCIDMNII